MNEPKRADLAFGLLVFLILVLARPAGAAAPSLYSRIRTARPDGPTFAVRDLLLDRGSFRLRLTSGTVTFLTPVDGRSFGAGFVGNGQYTLTPSNEIERRHLALVTRDDRLATFQDSISSAVLFWTDGTAEDLRAHATVSAVPDPAAAAALEKFNREERHDYETNFHLRILEALSGSAESDGAFLAFVEGKTASPALIAVDPHGIERERLASDLGAATEALFIGRKENGGFWYLSGDGKGARPPVRATGYDVETEIDHDVELKGTTTITLTAVAPGVRVIPVQLLSKLRVDSAAGSAAGPSPDWVSLEFVQEKVDEDGDLAVVLPAPLDAGKSLQLRISYSGKNVLFDAGDANYSVGARDSWYPNLGVFREPVPYRLTFRVPKGRDIVAIGEMESEKVEGDRKISVWESREPVRVAGFNYGKFRKISRDDKDSGFHLDVYTNPGTPDLIKEINMALQAAGSERVNAVDTSGMDPFNSPMASVPTYLGPRSVTVDTESLAESALVDGINSARIDRAYFGPLPRQTVAITQQTQWAFGQSWPSLIYLPYLAFLDSETRHTLNLSREKDFVEVVGPHEFAHQWWGHSVGWGSYRDQWLSEGFAEFSAALELEKSGGPKKAFDFWEKARKRILEKPKGSDLSNADAGPISLGFRLSTSRAPEAYFAVVYEKGAYVLSMLRGLMRDTASPNPDAGFIAMMKDFASTYAGKNPTTADFQAVAEKHMTLSMNATRDGKMDWFFREWVDGSEIPRYSTKVDVRDSGGGKYHLSGNVSQEGVSPEFRMLVPLYVEFSKGKVGRFGVVPMIGNATVPVDLELHLPEKPKKVIANALHDVLARD